MHALRSPAATPTEPMSLFAKSFPHCTRKVCELATKALPSSPGHFRGVDTGVLTVVVDDVVNVELTLGVELTMVEETRLVEELMEELTLTAELTELLEELGVGVGVADETEELLLLVSSMKSWRPFGPPHISVALPLQGMLQRPSVTGNEFAFRVFPQ